MRFAVTTTMVLSASVVQAQITVEGISDQAETSSEVVFRVLSEPGYTYTSTLDEYPIDEDQWITVEIEGYHQVDVTRTNNVGGGPIETERVRFAINSDRGNSEWGLWPWTPFPPIDSSSNETQSASLQVIVPSAFPPMMEIPIVTLMENNDGLWKRLNGTVAVSGFPGDGVTVKRGVGHEFLPGQETGTVINAQAVLKTASTNFTIEIDDSNLWTAVSGSITQNTSWTENSRIHVESGLLIDSGVELTVEKGTVVMVNPDIEIEIQGTLNVQGTRRDPVVFTPASRSAPWGGLILDGSASRMLANGAIFMGSGADPDWMDNNGYSSHRDEQPLLFLDTGSSAALTNVFITGGSGQAFHGEDGDLELYHCLVENVISAGQFNGGEVRVYRSALVGFPYADDAFADDDNDGLYLASGDLLIEDSLFGWAKDDGIDAGSGADGSVVMRRCWIEACFHEGLAMSSSGGSSKTLDISDTVAVNCGQAIEAGFGTPNIYADHCLLIDNEIGFRFGDNYGWNYTGSLQTTNSIAIHNYRDIWNFDRDTWAPHLDQTFIESNLFSITYSDYPSNHVWNASEDKGGLIPFYERETGVGNVGVGFPYPAASGDEIVTSVIVNVSLSIFSTNTVSVDLSVSGTATQGQDHALGNITVAFEPGELRKQIEIPVIDDETEEPAETIVLTLVNPINAEVSSSQSVFTYTIKANDFAVPDIIYVREENAESAAPFNSWATAATNIQDAVDQAEVGKLVLVSNGTYTLDAQISINKGITVRSVNGSDNTVVDGDNSVRCFYVSDSDALIDGFTVTRGYASTAAGIYLFGGGSVLNCTVVSNTAGPGTSGTDAGGIRCENGGMVSNSVVYGNSAGDDAGGIYCFGGGTVRGCVIRDNHTGDKGGGIYCKQGGTIENCTIFRNDTSNQGGGIYNDDGYVVNSVIYSNTASSAGNNHHTAGGTYSHCCSEPAPSANSIIDNPMFVDAAGNDFRLLPLSKCIDAGTPLPAIDIDIGYTPRPLDGDTNGVAAIDIGAHEYLHPDADSDGDGMSDGDEDIAGTSPANEADYLQMSTVTESVPGGIEVSWDGHDGRLYRIYTTTNLLPPSWSNVYNLSGSDGILTYTNFDPEADLLYIRIGVQEE